MLLFVFLFFFIFKSSSQSGSVYVCRLTDKHSVYAHKATADISLLGVRMPPKPAHPTTTTTTAAALGL